MLLDPEGADLALLDGPVTARARSGRLSRISKVHTGVRAAPGQAAPPSPADGMCRNVGCCLSTDVLSSDARKRRWPTQSARAGHRYAHPVSRLGPSPTLESGQVPLRSIRACPHPLHTTQVLDAADRTREQDEVGALAGSTVPMSDASRNPAASSVAVRRNWPAVCVRWGPRDRPPRQPPCCYSPLREAWPASPGEADGPAVELRPQ